MEWPSAIMSNSFIRCIFPPITVDYRRPLIYVRNADSQTLTDPFEIFEYAFCIVEFPGDSDLIKYILIYYNELSMYSIFSRVPVFEGNGLEQGWI